MKTKYLSYIYNCFIVIQILFVIFFIFYNKKIISRFNVELKILFKETEEIHKINYNELRKSIFYNNYNFSEKQSYSSLSGQVAHIISEEQINISLLNPEQSTKCNNVLEKMKIYFSGSKIVFQKFYIANLYFKEYENEDIPKCINYIVQKINKKWDLLIEKNLNFTNSKIEEINRKIVKINKQEFGNSYNLSSQIVNLNLIINDLMIIRNTNLINSYRIINKKKQSVFLNIIYPLLFLLLINIIFYYRIKITKILKNFF